MAINFSKNQDEIIKAWRDVVDSSKLPKWALFGYEGTTNNIKLMSTGAKGLEELVQEFNCSLIQYAFCRFINEELGINKLVLINWQGDSSPLSRKGLCASHVGDVANYFKGCTQTITIRNDDEATKEYLMEQIIKTSASKVNLSRQQQQSRQELSNEVNNVTTSIGSSYKRTDIGSEIASEDRKSFWQRQEEEEKERIAEEKRRAADRQAQFERERKLREESEAKKLAETIKERDRIIDATRQADCRNSSKSSAPPTNNQPQSEPVTSSNEDDGRVGRRSELIRLERNQETQSLISKGLIKNKRAIFEQAQQQNNQPATTTLSRRASGAMIAQRVNALKSLDTSGSSTAANDNSSPVNKLTNGFAKQVKVNVDGDDAGDVDSAKTSTVSSKVEPTHLIREEEDISKPAKTTSQIGPSNQEPEKTLSSTETNNKAIEENSKSVENGNKIDNFAPDVNGNEEIVEKPVIESNDISAINEVIIANGNGDVKAKALFDYEAADSTEISFDPNDIIGSIQKVDPGWWHGLVISGRFKGQSGLFPANYVKEV